MPNPHSPELWNTVAGRYDDLSPDQGLTDPNARQAWRELLAHHFPGRNQTILDAGCGTGSVSLLLAEMGHQATGIDFSPKMIDAALQKAKVLHLAAHFTVQDANAPSYPSRSFDAIVCRQVLWALPDPAVALRNWSALLQPGGKLLLIEGLFASGNGMSQDEIRTAMPTTLAKVEFADLSGQEALWGGPIPDQRYVVIAERITAS